MAKYTGKFTEDIGLQIWKNLSLDINKVSDRFARGLAQSAERQLYKWEQRVYDVLSDPLPEKEWHKKRDPSRLFPYLNKGKQVHSITSGVHFKVTGSGRFSISSWAKVGTVYSEFTSQGFKKRKDGVKPKWIGWLDDVFLGTRGFYSVQDVFDLITLERRAL